jgi:hypothetical protein
MYKIIRVVFLSMANVSAETEKTRTEVAEYLRKFADKLSPHADADPQERPQMGDDHSTTEDSQAADNSRVTVIVGNESATINPPDSISFGVEVDAEDSLLGSPTGERGVVFSLSWSSEDVETDDEIDIQ